MINLETIATITAIAATCGGVLIAFSRALWSAYTKLEARFDRLEHDLTERGHRTDLSLAELRSQIRESGYRLDQATAHRTAMEAKFYRVESAIISLSGALRRFTDFKPRGPEDWPTDDPPTEIRTRNRAS